MKDMSQIYIPENVSQSSANLQSSLLYFPTFGSFDHYYIESFKLLYCNCSGCIRIDNMIKWSQQIRKRF